MQPRPWYITRENVAQLTTEEIIREQLTLRELFDNAVAGNLPRAAAHWQLQLRHCATELVSRLEEVS